MIEITWIPEFIRGVFWVYIAAWAGLTLWVFVQSKTTSRRILALFFITVLFGALPAYWALSVKKHNDKQIPIQQQNAVHLKAAIARFDELCKTAGEKIDRIVEGVEGIVWIKWRPIHENSDQFSFNDPYGYNCGGVDCIKMLLIDERMVEIEENRWQPSNVRLYSYIDSAEDGSKNYSRYLKNSVGSELIKVVSTTPIPKFGVNWEDISTVEDRQFWIAGGKMQIIDLENNKIIAERIGYLIDKGQGNTSGYRNPWADAFSKNSACPSVREHNVSFITKVLKPKSQGK